MIQLPPMDERQTPAGFVRKAHDAAPGLVSMKLIADVVDTLDKRFPNRSLTQLETAAIVERLGEIEQIYAECPQPDKSQPGFAAERGRKGDAA
ncbi:MAG: hypothetical protein ACIALR_04240 [Blastopirellula sp. JB062]